MLRTTIILVNDIYLKGFVEVSVILKIWFLSILGKKACRYPGDPKNGRITPVKFLYEVGDRILIQCEAGHINTGKQKLQCMSNGSWSDRMPTCLSYRN